MVPAPATPSTTPRWPWPGNVLGGGGGDDESCSGDYEDYGDVDAFGAFRAAAAAAAGVEKATALAIVLLVIEHGAAPFDDPEVVALCRALAPEARESLVSSLEEYFGDFYETAAVELGALRYALLSTEERRAAVAEMAARGPTAKLCQKRRRCSSKG